MALFQDISQFNRTQDYLPIFNSVLIADIIIIILLYFTNVINVNSLKKYYLDFGVSAVILDVFIIVIGFIITRYLYNKIFSEFNIWKFLLLFLVIQITHDIIFYFLFNSIMPGTSRLMDSFQKYAKEAGVGAIIGDSSMIIIATLLASYLASWDLNSNLVLLIFLIYLITNLFNT